MIGKESGAAGMNPNDVYRYHTRYLPSVSFISHSKAIQRTGKYDKNFQKRAHDAWIIDYETPREVAQLLMLDLEINMKNLKQHRINVVSSPYKRCLQTAVLVAQEVGVDEIQVYYDFGEAVAASNNSGWDFAYEPLVNTRGEMHNIVSEASRLGELDREAPQISIGSFNGTELTVDDLNESDINYLYRISGACQQTAACLEQDGDHVIVVSHPTTLKKAAMHFISEDTGVYDVKPCGYMTVTTPSDGSAWISGRSRICVKPIKSEDPNKKIGFQLEGNNFAPEPE